jgi:hypothetical protein
MSQGSARVLVSTFLRDNFVLAIVSALAAGLALGAASAIHPAESVNLSAQHISRLEVTTAATGTITADATQLQLKGATGTVHMVLPAPLSACAQVAGAFHATCSGGGFMVASPFTADWGTVVQEFVLPDVSAEKVLLTTRDPQLGGGIQVTVTGSQVPRVCLRRDARAGSLTLRSVADVATIPAELGTAPLCAGVVITVASSAVGPSGFTFQGMMSARAGLAGHRLTLAAQSSRLTLLSTSEDKQLSGEVEIDSDRAVRHHFDVGLSRLRHGPGSPGLCDDGERGGRRAPRQRPGSVFLVWGDWVGRRGSRNLSRGTGGQGAAAEEAEATCSANPPIPPQARIQAMKPYLALAGLLTTLAVQGCGSTPAPGSSCSAFNDNVTVNSATVSIANVTYPQTSCQVIGQNVDVHALANGIASARFGGDGVCSLYQGQPTVAGSSPKTADYTARPPGGGLLYLNNAVADCTLTSKGMISVCGYGTLFSDGTPVGLSTNCNTDPILNVSVYRGSITVNIPKLGPPTHVTAGNAITFDRTTVLLTTSTAQFTDEQIATFDAQLDSLLFRVTPGDFTSFLKASGLSPSNVVLAPNFAQQKLEARYGSVAAMCAAVSVPIVFFPGDAYGKVPPQLYGGLCIGKTATVYGLAIYRPKDLAYRGATFYQVSGGEFIASQTFSKTLEAQVRTPLITWNGQFGKSFAALGSPGPASPDIYVAKFVYSLGSDSTPRIGLVAFSYGGASYPSVIPVGGAASVRPRGRSRSLDDPVGSVDAPGRGLCTQRRLLTIRDHVSTPLGALALIGRSWEVIDDH